MDSGVVSGVVSGGLWFSVYFAVVSEVEHGIRPLWFAMKQRKFLCFPPFRLEVFRRSQNCLWRMNGAFSTIMVKCGDGNKSLTIKLQAKSTNQSIIIILFSI